MPRWGPGAMLAIFAALAWLLQNLGVALLGMVAVILLSGGRVRFRWRCYRCGWTTKRARAWSVIAFLCR